MAIIAGGLWHKLLALQVYGANTGVGKTVASTILLKHFERKRSVKHGWRANYIKPISTGPDDEADERYVKLYAKCQTSTLVQYADPVSPHIAAANTGRVVSDTMILQLLEAKLRSQTEACVSPRWDGFTLVETAGGVMSPGPSGKPQADLFRPIRLPVILVGDHRLGGIASTISAFESLTVRGYDVYAVIMFENKNKLGNYAYLKEHFRKFGVEAYELPWIPNLEGCTPKEEQPLMKAYYKHTSGEEAVQNLVDFLLYKEKARLSKMTNLARRTRESIWHPFTQHQTATEEALVFDSAYGDFFQAKHTVATAKSSARKAGQPPMLRPLFDGSASWWTQGLGHGNPGLSLSAAYAAGRYGHVMFAGATHEPAVELAEHLMAQLDNPRLKKAFYTDNGSTGVEVGIKMALKAARKRYSWNESAKSVGVIGLKGSYHGDTLGAMDASEPSVYNEEVDWYQSRGHWFDYPRVKFTKGTWIIEPPADMEGQPKQEFKNLSDIFDFKTRGSRSHYRRYILDALDTLVKVQGRKFGALILEPVILGAGGMIFVDPLFQKTLVDVVRSYDFSPSPMTVEKQRAKHTWAGLPVIFDEVFTGLYRLGRVSGASFLQTNPDISIHAKLLTGGLLPLSITLASNSIFNAFLSDSKSDALLHGHSYTAHPIGCHVANTSLKMLRGTVKGATWKEYQIDWATDVTEPSAVRRVYYNSPASLSYKTVPVVPVSSSQDTASETPARSSQELNHEARSPVSVHIDTERSTTPTKPTKPTSISETVWSMWSKHTVTTLSHLPQVDHVIALGSVLAISLKDAEGSGYTSNAAAGLRDRLLNATDVDFGIHSRVLGNVLYLMSSMTASPQVLRSVEVILLQKMGEDGEGGQVGEEVGKAAVATEVETGIETNSKIEVKADEQADVEAEKEAEEKEEVKAEIEEEKDERSSGPVPIPTPS